MKGRNAGEDVGNHRYLDGAAGKPGAVADPCLLVSPMSDARVPTLAPISVSTVSTSQPAPSDNSAKSTFRRGKHSGYLARVDI
jgi:hypothetical protein